MRDSDLGYSSEVDLEKGVGGANPEESMEEPRRSRSPRVSPRHGEPSQDLAKLVDVVDAKVNLESILTNARRQKF
jgi:hypothetical protein